jgi:hypothetical protein
MSDTSNPFSKALGYFLPGDTNDPRVNPQLRQRIALAMMARDRKFPKNIGEGLSAIGDAIGDRRLAASLEQSDLAQQDAAQRLASGGGDTSAAAAPAGQTPGYATPGGTAATPPAVAAINAAAPITPPVAPVPAVAPPDVQPPPPLETAAAQPASMLGSDLPSGIQSVTATPLAQAMNPKPMAAPPPGAGGPAAEPVDPNERNALDENIDPRFGRRRAIAGIESGGARNPYTSQGAVTRTGDRAYGKYQMMGKNIPDWTQAALGRSLTPAQFLADSDAQDKTFDSRFGGYADKYGEAGAAKAWYAGERGMKNPNATDQYGRLTVRGYGQDYLNRLNGGQPAAPRDKVAAALLDQQSPPIMAQGGDEAPPTIPGATPPQPSTMAFSGVRAAPPQQPQIQTAPRPQPQPQSAQPQAVSGYVPPLAADPPGAPIVDMHPEHKRLQQLKVQSQNNPYAGPLLDLKMQPYVEERAQRQSEANERFKSQLLQAAEQNKLHYQSRVDQAQREANVNKTNVEARVQSLIDPNDKNIVLGPDNVGRPLKIEGQNTGGPPVAKLTEAQGKYLLFHGQATLAQDQLKGKEELLSKGLAQEAAGKVPFLGNAVQSAQYRQAKTASNAFVQAYLRATSGQNFGEKELQQHLDTLMPKYGDDTKTLSDKAIRRDNFLQGIYAGLPQSGRASADYNLEQSRGQEAARQSRVNDEMQGAEKVTGKIYVNPKTKARRVWSGTEWHDL